MRNWKSGSRGKGDSLGSWKQEEYMWGRGLIKKSGTGGRESGQSALEGGNKRSRVEGVVCLQDWKQGEQFC